MVRPGEAIGAAPRRHPDAATEAYWSRVQALRAALDDLRPVG